MKSVPELANSSPCTEFHRRTSSPKSAATSARHFARHCNRWETNAHHSLQAMYSGTSHSNSTPLLEHNGSPLLPNYALQYQPQIQYENMKSWNGRQGNCRREGCCYFVVNPESIKRCRCLTVGQDTRKRRQMPALSSVTSSLKWNASQQFLARTQGFTCHCEFHPHVDSIMSAEKNQNNAKIILYNCMCFKLSMKSE